MKSAWIDTGPIVAYLDAGDPRHRQVTVALNSFDGHLHTTGAVVTEAFHLVGQASEGPSRLIDFLNASEVEVFNCFTHEHLTRAAVLMRRYRNLPMDFADATLVVAAEELPCPEIFTLDRRGFRVYRMSDRRFFRLLLDE